MRCVISTARYKTIGRYVFIIFTLLQLAMSLWWLLGSGNLFELSDSTLSQNYIESVDGFITDEYMSVYYSYFLYPFVHFMGATPKMGTVIYLIQIAMVLLPASFLGHTVSEEKLVSVFIPLFIISIPEVLEVCCSILPNAFYLALILWIINATHMMIKSDTVPLIKGLKVLITVAVILFLGFMDWAQSVTDSYDRPKPTMQVVALNRFIWPHFAEITYAQNVVNEELTGPVDFEAMYWSSDRMIYDFVNKTETTYYNTTEEVYSEILKYAVSSYKSENLRTILRDVKDYFFTPFTFYRNLQGKGFSRNARTYYSIIHKDYYTSHLYFYFSRAVFYVLSIMAAYSYAIRKIRGIRAGFPKIRSDYFVQYILFAMLLFSIVMPFFCFRGFSVMNSTWISVAWALIAITVVTGSNATVGN